MVRTQLALIKCAVSLRFVLAVLLIGSLLSLTSSASAQPGVMPEKKTTRVPTTRTPKTDVTVELLTGEEGVGLSAHRWHEVFERLQVTLTVRRGVAGDQLDVSEQGGAGGAARKVRVVGKLEKSGRLVFPDRAFTEAQAGQLARWLRDLQEFGAQGSPSGQPAWGLTKGQFGSLFTALSHPHSADVTGKNVEEALKEMGLPAEYKLRYLPGASRVIAGGGTPLRQSATGIALGSALAIVLSEQGLGFRPRRQPDGTIELQVATPAEANDLWPVGWPLQASNPKTAPKYFALTKIDLNDVTLAEVLTAAPDYMGMPIAIDYRGLDAKKIDFSQIKVKHPMRQTTWSLALKELTFKGKAQPNLVIDESGTPFVWVTPLGAVRKPGAKPADLP